MVDNGNGSNPREYVTYEKMVGYVDGVIRPINAHASAHDAWHLLQVQNEQQRDDAREAAMRATRIQRAMMFIALASVIVAMIAVFLSHIHL